MDKEKQKAIASKGGIAAHVKGNAHEFNSESARLAGAKGGRKVAENKAHMAAIGKLGGMARSEQIRLRKQKEDAEKAGVSNG
jgi:general stress protein YciG